MSFTSSYHVECFCDNCQNMKIDASQTFAKKKPLKFKSLLKSLLKRLLVKSDPKPVYAGKEFDYQGPEMDNMRNYMQDENMRNYMQDENMRNYMHDQMLALTPEEEDNRQNELAELREQIVVLLVPSPAWGGYNVPDCDICARGDFNPLTVRQIPQAQI
ncbi:unnamed protein product [Bemisia tabaci]|uniref:Uncharacterized protein n=1 Tax=Bemisia tabaci TaxID=7038 RepID=A0A9P0F895_BEMTA|nr:PREDICTED: uncharacterized protein LOC109043338 [Bemisia tabaci]CAH0392062.1 unnamed protein product [Bemisia tabaci]